MPDQFDSACDGEVRDRSLVHEDKFFGFSGEFSFDLGHVFFAPLVVPKGLRNCFKVFVGVAIQLLGRDACGIECVRVPDRNPPCAVGIGFIRRGDLHRHAVDNGFATSGRKLVQSADFFHAVQVGGNKLAGKLLCFFTGPVKSVDADFDSCRGIRIPVDVQFIISVGPEGQVGDVLQKSFLNDRCRDLAKGFHPVEIKQIIRRDPPGGKLAGFWEDYGVGDVAVRAVVNAFDLFAGDRGVPLVEQHDNFVPGLCEDSPDDFLSGFQNQLVVGERGAFFGLQEGAAQEQKGENLKKVLHMPVEIWCIAGNSNNFSMRFSNFFLPVAACLVITGCVTAPKPPEITTKEAWKSHSVKTGPFWWGTSTSNYQNEDRAAKPGSPEFFRTDWDVFSEEEGKAAVRGEYATFSWTHFDKDIEVLKKIGVNHFRFGIEWARVEPRPGEYNEKAIRQYVDMARRLRAAGIEPVVTLWHFTFPDWLYTTNPKPNVNFLHPDQEEAWKRFVQKMVKALAPEVRVFIPQNEPNGAVQLGWLAAHWPPGLFLNTGSYKKALDQAVKNFRYAAEVIRKERPDALVMSVHSLPMWRKNLVMDPTLVTYHTLLRQNFDHLDKIYDVCDLIGINYYYSQNADIPDLLNHGSGEKSLNYTQMGWKIDPRGLFDIIKQVGTRYEKPMVIVENGIGTQNELKRIKYLRDHVNQVRRALAAGYDVRGYFAWTLVDNYEWTEGFEPKFGLSVMDPKTKRRTLEPSGRFFGEMIRAYGNLRKDYRPQINPPQS